MKIIFTILLAALLGWFPASAQKKDSGKQVHIKAEREINGETVKIDSVFGSKKEADAYLESQGFEAPPMPPAPPAVKGKRAPMPPSPPGNADRSNRKRVEIRKDNSDEKEYVYAYTISQDIDSLVETKLKRAFDLEIPEFDGDFEFHHGSPGRKMVMRTHAGNMNSYRLEFSMPESGTAKITVQGENGKMLYEENLEGVQGDFTREFDLDKYKGATLQLNVQSGKSKQSRKLVL
jgi:hypothetical protein